MTDQNNPPAITPEKVKEWKKMLIQSGGSHGITEILNAADDLTDAYLKLHEENTRLQAAINRINGLLTDQTNKTEDFEREAIRLHGIVEKQRSALESVRHDYNTAAKSLEVLYAMAIESGEMKTTTAFAMKEMRLTEIRARLFMIEEALALTATEKDA